MCDILGFSCNAVGLLLETEFRDMYNKEEEDGNEEENAEAKGDCI